MSLTLVSGPAVEPVSVQQFKAHARIARDDEDSLITAYIVAARSYVESRLRRQLITATWRLSLDSFFDDFGRQEISIPRPPLQSVTSIQYYDTDGVLQTLAADQYVVDSARQPGRIARAYGVTWPGTRCIVNAVRVTYVAGYGSAATDVPEPIRHAIRMLASHWYENREPVAMGISIANLPFAVDSLLMTADTGAYG